MIAAYRYDAFNRRIIKTVDQTTYRYTYDDWNIVEISTSANDYDYINIIDHGMDNHIAIEVFDGTNSEIYYFLTDERGNVVALTDEIGNIVERYRYLVYGEHIVLNELFVEKDCGIDTCYAGNLHNFLWGGSMHEPETDLYWMRNRYYHKGMKRFVNQDPIGIWGDANNLGNGFAYVAGMVVEGIDPTGLANQKAHEEEEDYMRSPVAKSVSAVFGAASEYKVDLYSLKENFEKEFQGIFSSYVGIDLWKAIVNLIERQTPEDALAVRDALQKIFKMPGSRDIFAAMGKAGINSIQRTVITEKGVKVYRAGEHLEGVVYTFYHNSGNVYRKLSCGKFQKQVRVGGFWLFTRYEWVDVDYDPTTSCPADPDNGMDSVQTVLINNLLQNMLRMGDNKSIYEEGPVIEFESEGPSGNTQKIFIFNPFYRGKDPMEEIIWKIKTDGGTWGFIRNPFAPGADTKRQDDLRKLIESGGVVGPRWDPRWDSRN